jgi:hypothetical protein
MEQYLDFEGRLGVFRDLDSLKNEIKARSLQVNTSVAATHSRWNPKRVWSGYLRTARELTMCVMALLSVTATEASVERSFSLQGLVHSKRRNRLEDMKVEREMFIKMNTHALAGDVKPDSGAWIEIDDDVEAKLDQHLFLPYLGCERDPEEPLDPLAALVMPGDDELVAPIALETEISDQKRDGPDPSDEAELTDADAARHVDQDDVDDEEIDEEDNTAPQYPRPVKELLRRFFKKYAFGPKSKFSSDKCNWLQTEAISLNIKDSLLVLQGWVRKQAKMPEE